MMVVATTMLNLWRVCLNHITPSFPLFCFSIFVEGPPQKQRERERGGGGGGLVEEEREQEEGSELFTRSRFYFFKEIHLILCFLLLTCTVFSLHFTF
jgi:hypothetical protein